MREYLEFPKYCDRVLEALRTETFISDYQLYRCFGAVINAKASNSTAYSPNSRSKATPATLLATHAAAAIHPLAGST
jgi:hypothetical protein